MARYDVMMNSVMFFCLKYNSLTTKSVHLVVVYYISCVGVLLIFLKLTLVLNMEQWYC